MQSNEYSGAGGSGVQPPVVAHPVAEGEHDHAEEHVHLPPPSVWPITVALGVALGGFGLVSVWQMSILGLIIMFYGIINWVQELRHEPH